MNGFVILAAALLPAVLLFFYIWKKDPQPEPTGQLVKALLWGVAIIVPVSVVEGIIQAILFGGGQPSNLVGTTALAFLVAALPEESFKLLALWLVLRKNPYFDEHFDGIVYAVCVGLGFAAVENVSYVFGNIDDWMSVAAMRALLAVPGHYAFAVLMGYYYGKMHFAHSKWKKLRLGPMVLLAPIVAHGIYDGLLMMNHDLPAVIAAAISIAFIVFLIRLHRYSRVRIKRFEGR